MKKKLKGQKHPTGSATTLASKAGSTSWTASPSKSIRINKAFPLPSYAKEAIQKLGEEGYVAYVVGGGVRDFLLGVEIKDVDLATDADPQEICRLFPDSVTVGKAFGVIKVNTGLGAPMLEIATFRKDLDYEDHRRPKGVLFSSPIEDAHRRDFTINALFFDPKTKQILDATGQGLDDLKAKIIRAIGHPHKRFKEDALRLLRAIRFQTRFGFELEAGTAVAIQEDAKLINRVSFERVRDEVSLMISGARPAEALDLLSQYGLLKYILPEIETLKIGPPGQTAWSHRHPESLWEHLLKSLTYLSELSPRRPAWLSWAALLHEVGRPMALERSSGKDSIGHEVEGAQLAFKIATRMKMSRLECDQISKMIENHLKFKEVFQMREATLQRFIREPDFEDWLSFHRADAMASDGNLAFYEYCAYRFGEYQKTRHLETQKLITGKDLIQLGFEPGPEFSKILRVIEDHAFEKSLQTKEAALEYIIKNFVN